MFDPGCLTVSIVDLTNVNFFSETLQPVMSVGISLRLKYYYCFVVMFMTLPPLSHALGFIEDVITRVGIVLPPPILREIGILSKFGHWLLLL